MLSYAQIAYLRAFGAGAPTGGTLDELMAEIGGGAERGAP